MKLNEPLVLAHIFMVFNQTMLLLIANISKSDFTAAICHLALLLVNSLIDILMCCIINMVASEQLRNKIVQDGDQIRYVD